MDHVKFYLEWAMQASKELGISARWWCEHHGWQGVCWLIDNGGEETMTRSFERWCQPELPFGRR